MLFQTNLIFYTKFNFLLSLFMLKLPDSSYPNFHQPNFPNSSIINVDEWLKYFLTFLLTNLVDNSSQFAFNVQSYKNSFKLLKVLDYLVETLRRNIQVINFWILKFSLAAECYNFLFGLRHCISLNKMEGIILNCALKCPQFESRNSQLHPIFWYS